jgi:hypothetical protein
MIVPDDPSFRLPAKLDTPIWRYLDFARFVSMLEVENGSLHFARVDTLTDDRFEGLPPRQAQSEMLAEWDEWTRQQEHEGDRQNFQDFVKCIPDALQQARRRVAVNCWHCSEDESAAMWKVYAGNRGIAVQSTVKCLLNSLQNTTERIRVGLIEYGAPSDWRAYVNARPSMRTEPWFMWKRKSFAHEKELRAFVGDPLCGNALPEFGVTVAVPLQTLIQSIVVAPTAPPWCGDLVRQVCDRYGLHVKVEDSNLDERSLW